MSRFIYIVLLVLTNVICFAACGRESDSHFYGDSDTASDSDADSDVDSDADSDTDTDSEFETDTGLPPGCEGVISFPDPGLDKVIRLAIGIHSGDIYYEDLQGLTSLYLSDSG